MVLNKKKGAIELSMTTIIVIVIGVTLLILGLTWVRSTFENISELTEDQFRNAKAIIETAPNTDEKLTLPLELSINRGESKGIRIYLINDGTSDSDTFEVLLEENDPAEGIEVGIIGAKPGQPKSVVLSEGDGPKEIDVLVTARNSAKTEAYTFNVLVNGGSYEEKGFIVIVKNE